MSAPVERKDVPVSDQWDLTLIFRDAAAWEADFNAWKALVPQIGPLQGTLGSSKTALKAVLDLNTQVERLGEKLGEYAHLKTAEDVADSVSGERMGRFMSVATQLSAAFSFLTPEIQALDDAELVPQADPNTASQSQRMMKIVGLKQLQQQNPSMYDPIAIDTAAMQAMGWSNPQQFMVPPSALQQKPPPEVQYAQAMVGIKKQEADAKTAMVQVKAQEAAAKAAQAQQGGQGGAPDGQPTFLDQIKEQELQLKQNELQIKQQDSMMDALNRKRDRESRERLAAVKLAQDMGDNPQAIPVVQNFLEPDMIKRLEDNEQPLTSE